MGARYYCPDLGRFASRDPIGGHGYAYARDDPVAFWDPSGLASIQELQREPLLPSDVPAAPEVVVDFPTYYAGLAANDAVDDVGALDASPASGMEPNEPTGEAPGAGIPLQEAYYGNPYLRALYGAPSYAFLDGYVGGGAMVGGGVPTNEPTPGVPTNVGEADTEAFSGVPTNALPDDNVLVVRGGRPGRLGFLARMMEDESEGISVNSAPGKSVEELSQGIAGKNLAVTTRGALRAAGAELIPDPIEATELISANPYHYVIFPGEGGAPSIADVWEWVTR